MKKKQIFRKKSENTNKNLKILFKKISEKMKNQKNTYIYNFHK